MVPRITVTPLNVGTLLILHTFFRDRTGGIVFYGGCLLFPYFTKLDQLVTRSRVQLSEVAQARHFCMQGVCVLGGGGKVCWEVGVKCENLYSRPSISQTSLIRTLDYPNYQSNIVVCIK